MAFQVKDLMFTLNPHPPVPMHLTCGPLSVDSTQCPAVHAKEPRKGTGIEQLRRQLAEVREEASPN